MRRLAALLVACACTLAGAASASAAPPRLTARTAFLLERSTGDVVYVHAADERRPIASTTKLMTALLALERLPLSRVLHALPYNGLPAESVIHLRAGEAMTARDLLRGLLLASANDAAATLAVRIAGSRAAFVRRMNARARSLGLANTHYSNPIGLDEAGNYSSAADLVTLARLLLRNRFFAETVRMRQATLRSGARPRLILNRNTLLRAVPWVDGVKTGHTQQAGYVLVGAGRLHGVTMLSAVLGEPSEGARNADTLALLRYGLARYRVSKIVRARQVLARVKLAHRDEHVDLVAERPVMLTVRRGERPAVVAVGVPAELDGPLPAGARVGSVEVRRHGATVATVGLVTARPVDAAGLLDRLRDRWGGIAPFLLLGLLVACTLGFVRLRRRKASRRRAELGRSTETA